MIKKPSLVTRAAVAPDWCLTGATTESWFTLIWSEHGGSRHQPSRSQYLLNQSKNKMALALTCCLNVFYLCMQSSILFTAEIVVDSKNIRSTAGLGYQDCMQCMPDPHYYWELLTPVLDHYHVCIQSGDTVHTVWWQPAIVTWIPPQLISDLSILSIVSIISIVSIL